MFVSVYRYQKIYQHKQNYSRKKYISILEWYLSTELISSSNPSVNPRWNKKNLKKIKKIRWHVIFCRRFYRHNYRWIQTAKTVQWHITYTDIITDEPLWDYNTNHSKLLIVAQIFTIKLDYGLTEASYEKIIEWVRNILLEGNVLKDNFHAAKSMMKPLV